MSYRRKSTLPGFPWQGKFTTKKDIEQYFSNPDGIQCLLCGRIHKALGKHLLMVHGVSHEEYRDRYGLPWRRGLVSRELSNRLSDNITKRIRDGSFIPKPDNEAAVKALRTGGRRKDQPFVTGRKSEMTKGLSQKNVKYSHKDYENVLSVMLDRKVALREACMDNDLPAESRVLDYAAKNPGFRKELIDTYYALPYAVQARADMFSPQFYEELGRLKKQGLTYLEIGERLGISNVTVSKRLKQMV